MMNLYFPGQKKEIRWGKVKAFFWGFAIAAFLFTGLGYGWRMAQTDQPHKDHVSKLNAQISDMKSRLAAKEGNRPVKIIVRGKN